jgi:hypothetical protein
MTPIARPKLDGFDFLDYLGGDASGGQASPAS